MDTSCVPQQKEFGMANSVKVNAIKGGESAVVLVLATIISKLAVEGAKQLGVDIDNIQVQTAVAAGLAGAYMWIRNWWKHRKDPKPVVVKTDKPA